MSKYILIKCVQFTVLQNKSFLRNIGILLLYVALSGQIDAQTLKTYKGRMSERPVERIDFGINLGMSLRPEIWSYQYYEDENGERVYHGKLTYSFQYAPNAFYTIAGQYSHGKKEGQWIYQAVGSNKKVSGKLMINYHNDLFDGNFSYQGFGTSFIGDYKMNGSFSNGHLIGTMTCSVTGLSEKKYYEASYANGGYPEGNWKYNKIGPIVENTEFRFLNNCLITQTVVDQSTGKTQTKKTQTINDDYRGIFIPDSIARNISESNRGFRIGNTCYTFEDASAFDFEYATIDEGFKEVHALYKALGYTPKYLKAVKDKARNDSIAEVERQQKEQERLIAENAEMSRLEAEKKKIYEARQTHLLAVSQTKELADRIEIAYSIRKDAKKWINVKELFDIVSSHHADYEDTPENISFLNDYYKCVYRIFNSEIDNKTRRDFEALIASGLTEVRATIGKSGGWRLYCEPDKIIRNFVQQAEGLMLTDFDAIPEITEQEKMQFEKDSEKKVERAKKILNLLNKLY